MRKCKLTVQRGSKALEMTMRDVLDSLEEISNATQYQCASESIQILSIEMPQTAISAELSRQTRQITNIHSVTSPPKLHRSKDIVSYLLEREERQEPPLSA